MDNQNSAREMSWKIVRDLGNTNGVQEPASEHDAGSAGDISEVLARYLVWAWIYRQSAGRDIDE